MLSEWTSLSESMYSNQTDSISSMESVESAEREYREYQQTEYGSTKNTDSKYYDNHNVYDQYIYDEKWQHALQAAYLRGFNKGYSMGVQFKLTLNNEGVQQ